MLVHCFRTYPKGKTCSFIMSVQRFIEEYKKAVYPLKLYTIQHDNHSSVSVTSEGFVKDQCFIDKLANLSLHGHINGSKTFYNRLILVPTHRNQTNDIIGNITLKITAKVSRSKQKSISNRPHHVAPSPVPTSLLSNPLSEIPANTSVKYLPNVWFPPPLCFTSQTTAKQCNHDDELEVQRYNDKPCHLVTAPPSKTDKQCYTKPIGNNGKAVPCIDSTIRLEHCHHWKDVAGYHSTSSSMLAGSFPWKGDVIEGFTHNMIQYTTQRKGQETPPVSAVTTPVSVTPPMPVAPLVSVTPPVSESIASAMVHSGNGDRQYPYLTGLFKDLMLLHGRSGLESSTHVSTEDSKQPKANVTDQAVQTDEVNPPKVVRSMCQSEGTNNLIEVEKQLTSNSISGDMNTLSHSTQLLHDEQQITDYLTSSISSSTSTDSHIPGKSTTNPLITVSRASINTLSNDSLNSGGLPLSNSPKYHLNPTLSKDSSLDSTAAVRCSNIGQRVFLAASLQSIDREDDNTIEEDMTPPNYPTPPGEAISDDRGTSLEQLSNEGETASSYDSNSYSDDFESCSDSSN